MKKFGGPNKIRQKCRLKQCIKLSVSDSNKVDFWHEVEVTAVYHHVKRIQYIFWIMPKFWYMVYLVLGLIGITFVLWFTLIVTFGELLSLSCLMGNTQSRGLDMTRLGQIVQVRLQKCLLACWPVILKEREENIKEWREGCFQQIM